MRARDAPVRLQPSCGLRAGVAAPCVHGGARYCMHCLLVSPRFPDLSYWNYREPCELLGARYPAAPLGLITAAALLPSDWHIRLLDLNTRPMDPALLDWADLV